MKNRDVKLNIGYSVKRIPLMKKGKNVIQKYYAFWKKDNSGYYVEEFAEMLKREFNKKQQKLTTITPPSLAWLTLD